MLSFDTDLSNALKNSNTTAFWVLKLYYNDESAFIGVSDRHRQDGTDIYYGIVASWGVYRQSLDFFNFTTSTANMSVTLINTKDSIKGGRFTDLFATNNFENRKWELFLNTNETSTLDTAARMIGTGVISGEVNYDHNNIVLSLLSNNSKYHKRLPTSTVASATYSGSKNKNIGKPIPMAFGDFYEKTDIGTIPTSHFDRLHNFYKGAFPAIVVDEWDVQNQESKALADSVAIHTLDAENIYTYKDGLYATLTDANNAVSFPSSGTYDGTSLLDFRGNTASVYLPLSTSNLASESVTGSGSVANEERVGDGSFSAVAQWLANGATTNNSVANMTFAFPKINKLGVYSAIKLLTKWGTVTDFTAEGASGNFTMTVGSSSVTESGAITNTETATDASGLFSSDKRDAWDFEGSIVYALNAGSGNNDNAAQIYESGVRVDFTLEDFTEYQEEEIFEGYRYAQRMRNDNERVGYEGYQEFYTYVIQPSIVVPAKIDYVYYSGKGRKYGAWVDADSRNNGYNQNDLIENPIYIIESVLRDELGLSSSNIDYAAFDTSGNTTNGDISSILNDATADVKFAFSQFKFIDSQDFIDKLAKLSFSYVFMSGDGKFKIKTLRDLDDYSSVNATINFEDVNLNKISKTALSFVKNKIIFKYNYDYGAKQTLSETTSSDSTSQGSTVNGFNQAATIEIIASQVIDDTTATKLAAAYKELMKNRRNILEFSTNSPKYNHLEIGDIINFTNFTEPKIYGTEVNDGDTNKYYIISDISKSITSANIECIQVGDVDV
tara:strand:+ start:2350 stop:4692 length:2343 start_codon:yes stop_codon:yes gene_type:complete